MILITGAADGLGAAVAADLAAEGATLLLHGRSEARAQEAVDAVRERTGSDRLRPYHADLASLDEVRRMADAVLDAEPRLDVLVNNAGIGTAHPGDGRRLESADGHELRFAVNYLAGYLLTRRLLGLLERSAPARIVNVASAGQMAIDFDDVMLEHRYSAGRAYTQSKLAQILFTFDLAEELEGRGRHRELPASGDLHADQDGPRGARQRDEHDPRGRRRDGAPDRRPRAGRGHRPLLRGHARGRARPPGLRPGSAAAAARALRAPHRRGLRPHGTAARRAART